MAEIDHHIIGGTLVVRPRGRLDAHVCIELDRMLGALCGPSAHNLVLNLQDVTYLSGASLRVCVQIYRQAARQSGQFALAGIQP